MLKECIGFFVVLIALAAIGLGPSLWLLSAGQRWRGHVLAIAPTIGYALIGLLGFPLVRYVGPVQSWSWPVTLALLVVSLGATALFGVRRHPVWLPGSRRWQDWIFLAAGALVLLALCGPLLLRGINYAVFRANASDSFLQLSLAAQLNDATWQTILGGVELSARNLTGLRQLAAASPTAIFSARTIAFPIGLSKVVTLSWATDIAGVPIYLFAYAHYLLAYALAFFLSLAIGDLIKLPRGLNFMAAAVVALGFWARF